MAPRDHVSRPAAKGQAGSVQLHVVPQAVATTLPILPVRERMLRDWLRGVGTRSLRVVYRGVKREVIENSIRERVQARGLGKVA